MLVAVGLVILALLVFAAQTAIPTDERRDPEERVREMERGIGITKGQIEGAPPNAVYVWCNGVLSYPRDLAKRVGRNDIEFVAPHWLRLRAWAGSGRPIVLDHALDAQADRDPELMRAICEVRSRRVAL